MMSQAPAPPPAAPSRRPGLLRLLPLLALLAGLGAFFAFGGHRYLTFEQLQAHRHALVEWVARNGAGAALLFGAMYALMVAFSIPGGILATITAGFLFGIAVGTVTVVIGATLGAIVVFVAARTALGDFLRARAGPFVQRLEAGFKRDAFNYLLVLRLVPLFPFWLINLVPAFFGVKLRTFALATFLGIIPGAFVFVTVGNGLGAVLDQGGVPDYDIVFKPFVIGPIVLLALLSLLPVLYRRFRRKRGA
ncbi:MAG: TVP38/TMEM64 family protein [Alphaproteobacteria bacterium]